MSDKKSKGEKNPSASDQEKDKKAGHGNLTYFIVGAIILAIITGFFAPQLAVKFHLGGKVFLNLLMMMVVPLVMMSVMSGILGLGDVRKLGKPGGVAVLYYMCTTVLAVVVGLIVVNIIKPGINKDLEKAKVAVVSAESPDERAKAEEKLDKLKAEITAKMEKSASQHEEAVHAKEKNDEGAPTLGQVMKKMVLLLFTDNLIKSAFNMDLLPLIFFSIVFACMLTTMGERVFAIKRMIGQINDALMSFIMLLMNVAPIGIFCLVAANIGAANGDGTLTETLKQQAGYIATILVGLSFHAFVTLFTIYWLFTKKNPLVFFKNMSQAILTALSTSSSTATLPVTMECAVDKAGLSKKSTNFVVPLGATINMDGTALYEAAAAIFIAQIYFPLTGQELTMMTQVTIAVTATLAAIGAAGIPEAGLITMLIVLNAAGLPAEGIGMIVMVDWLLDRFRTAVNCFGDSVGAAIVDTVIDKEGDSALDPEGGDLEAEPAGS